jgi:WD40 repeat protein
VFQLLSTRVVSPFSSASIAASALMLAAFAPGLSAQTLMHSENTLLAIDDVAITPDQHYAVVRQNRDDQFARVYDLTTGALAASPAANPSDGLCGECLDAVAVTNTRAIVLGNVVQILDLTNLASPVLAATRAGYHPRDVAITPDGTIAAVRGGETLFGMVGGSYLFDIATGAQIGFHAGEPTPYGSGGTFSFDVDDVAVTNTHAVAISFISNGGGTPDARVTIWELHPSGGGPPAVAFETTTSAGTRDQSGAPYDLAITPDGTKVIVRSELEIGAYDLSVSPPAVLWLRRPAGNPGLYHEEALDAVEVTNDRVLTISKLSNPALGNGTQVDVYDMSGVDHFARTRGSPHDLAITPDGTRGFVRTSTGAFLYDLVNLPSGQDLTMLSRAEAPSASIQYFGGLDSVAVTNRFAVGLCRAANHLDMIVHIYDISGSDLVEIAAQTVQHTRPIDLAITPDETKLVITGNSNVTVYELATGAQLFTYTTCPQNAYYPWCNGVAVSNDRAVATCQWGPQNGWVTIVDIAPFASNYCVGAPNSAGAGARISANGTASVAANNLKIFVGDAPRGVTAQFYYGANAVQTPFGNGFMCVGGTIYPLSMLSLNEDGAGWLPVDYAHPPPGGQITPGSTWRFQCEYRDNAAGGARFNTSDAMSIVFVP